MELMTIWAQFRLHFYAVHKRVAVPRLIRTTFFPSGIIQSTRVWTKVWYPQIGFEVFEFTFARGSEKKDSISSLLLSCQCVTSIPLRDEFEQFYSTIVLAKIIQIDMNQKSPYHSDFNWSSLRLTFIAKHRPSRPTIDVLSLCYRYCVTISSASSSFCFSRSERRRRWPTAIPPVFDIAVVLIGPLGPGCVWVIKSSYNGSQMLPACDSSERRKILRLWKRFRGWDLSISAL